MFNIEQITRESSITSKKMIDQINKNIRALQSLGEPVQHWDTLLIHIITQKLDCKTFREWEESKRHLPKDKPIKLDAFFDFLRNRADVIETLEFTHSAASQSSNNHFIKSNKLKTMVSIHNSGDNIQSTCRTVHNSTNSLSKESRLEILPKFKVCFNCFQRGHFANHCKNMVAKYANASITHLFIYLIIKINRERVQRLVRLKRTPIRVRAGPKPLGEILSCLQV